MKISEGAKKASYVIIGIGFVILFIVAFLSIKNCVGSTFYNLDSDLEASSYEASVVVTAQSSETSNNLVSGSVHYAKVQDDTGRSRYKISNFTLWKPNSSGELEYEYIRLDPSIVTLNDFHYHRQYSFTDKDGIEWKIIPISKLS